MKNYNFINFLFFIVMIINCIMCFIIGGVINEKLNQKEIIYTVPECPYLLPEEQEIKLSTIQINCLKPANLDEANKALELAIKNKDSALKVYEGLLELNYDATHPAFIMAKENIKNTIVNYNYYKEQQILAEKNYEWEKRREEYPVATEVWLYMKNNFGWNDIVCAGIMGNMMAESGGCWTADLDWDLRGKKTYGMIQWLGERKKELFSIYGNTPNIEEQLIFMRDELYGTNGVTKQVSDKVLNQIMDATTPEDCAFIFATYYERCNKEHRERRKEYARKAYEYFVGGIE